jgi:hypothetical protein
MQQNRDVRNSDSVLRCIMRCGRPKVYLSLSAAAYRKIRRLPLSPPEVEAA